MVSAITVNVPDDTPLLWVLRDHLNLTGTKYGCGMSLCGACTVHIDGAPTRSCTMPVSALKPGVGDHDDRRREVEGSARPCRRRGKSSTCRNAAIASRDRSCRATGLLAKKKKPTDADIDERDGRQRLPLRDLRAHSRGDPRSGQDAR